MNTIHNFWRLSLFTVTACCSLLIKCEVASAQSSALIAQYYQNQYSLNPAFAGFDEGFRANLHYQNQWRVIPGSPVLSSLTGDYRMNNKVGLGLKIYSDKAGLISRNAVSGSYAYHLPLNSEGHNMHFGLSLGLMKNTLDNQNIVGEENDIDGDLFNTRKVYLDGDFGIAYTTERLNIQGALPNMKTFFKKDYSNTVQSSYMYLALSYKIGRSLDIISVEPKISYQGSNGIESILNLGANFNFLNEMVSFTGMYNSAKKSSMGMGLKYQNYLLQGFYTSQLAGHREVTGGSFELHLKIEMKKGGAESSKR